MLASFPLYKMVRQEFTPAHGYETPALLHDAGVAQQYRATMDVVREHLESLALSHPEAAAYLDQQVQGLRARGIRLEASLRHGGAAREIAAAAGENPGSLIVMSTHGRTGVGRAILGSVATAVVRESGAPVLLIRAGAAP